jgi:hypothetical protein
LKEDRAMKKDKYIEGRGERLLDLRINRSLILKMSILGSGEESSWSIVSS